MATQTSLAALGVGPSSVSNAATAAGMGAQALFLNPLTIGIVAGLVLGIGIHALSTRLRSRRSAVEDANA